MFTRNHLCETKKGIFFLVKVKGKIRGYKRKIKGKSTLNESQGFQ